MDDFKEIKGKYRRDVWESSKGFQAGMCKWSVSYACPELGRWYKVKESHFAMNPDKAFQQSEEYLAEAIAGDYGDKMINGEM